MLTSKKKQELDTLANDLAGIVNGGNEDVYNCFVAQINCKHRTLQQSLMRNIIIPMINQWANNMKKGWYDLRNQSTCELSEIIVEKAIAPYVNENGLPYI